MDLQTELKQTLKTCDLDTAYLILNQVRVIFQACYQMKCAWCGLTLRTGHTVFGESHGVCQPCADKYLGGKD